jgi:hypothetical protein
MGKRMTGNKKVRNLLSIGRHLVPATQIFNAGTCQRLGGKSRVKEKMGDCMTTNLKIWMTRNSLKSWELRPVTGNTLNLSRR